MAKGPRNRMAREKTEKKARPGATHLSEWLRDKDHVARRHDIWDLLEWHTRVIAPEIAKRHSLWHRFLRLLRIEKPQPTPWELLQMRARQIRDLEAEREAIEAAEDEVSGRAEEG